MVGSLPTSPWVEEGVKGILSLTRQLLGGGGVSLLMFSATVYFQLPGMSYLTLCPRGQHLRMKAQPGTLRPQLPSRIDPAIWLSSAPTQACLCEGEGHEAGKAPGGGGAHL